ncbi:hypothetical protein PSHT_01019, partial [Puccinia striiformis]
NSFEAQTPSTDAPSPSVQSEISVENSSTPIVLDPEVEGLFDEANSLLGTVTLAALELPADVPALPDKGKGRVPNSPKLEESQQKAKTPSVSPPKAVPTLIPTQPSPQRQKRSAPASEIKVVIPMSTPMTTTAPRKVLAPKPKAAPAAMTHQVPVKVPNYPLIPGMTTVPFESVTSMDMDIDPMEAQDPTAEGDPSMDIVPTNLNSFEDQLVRVYRRQYRMYQTAKDIGHLADMKKTLTECQRSYRDVSKRLTWQFALSVNEGWNPFKEAKHLKALQTNAARANPVASSSRLPPSSNGCSNKGDKTATTLQLGKIPKADISVMSASINELQRSSERIIVSKDEEQDKYESLTSDIDSTHQLLQNVAVAVNDVSSSLANFQSESSATARESLVHSQNVQTQVSNLSESFHNDLNQLQNRLDSIHRELRSTYNSSNVTLAHHTTPSPHTSTTPNLAVPSSTYENSRLDNKPFVRKCHKCDSPDHLANVCTKPRKAINAIEQGTSTVQTRKNPTEEDEEDLP